MKKEELCGNPQGGAERGMTPPEDPRSSLFSLRSWFRNLLKVALPLLLGGFILYWVYRDFDFAQAARVLRHGIRWDWMALSLFFGVWSHVERAMRWRQTLEPLGYRPRASRLVDAIYLSYATSLVIPRVGEVSRCGVLSRYEAVPFSRSMGTVVTERLVDTLCMLFLAGVTLVLELPVMLLVMALLTIPALVRGKLSRVQGVALLCIYAAFCAVQFTM